MPAPERVIALLTVMFRKAFRVRELALDQLTVSFTKMSPLVPDAPYLSVPVFVPVWVWMITLLVPSAVPSAAPVMSPPLEAMVKSTGSSSQVPVRPLAALVSTTASEATFTLAPEVSTKPPLPPFGAEASSVPPTVVVPVFKSERRTILPDFSPSVCASMIPLLLTAALVSSSAA